jgi:tetraacyldisaccharide 4'-kinase
MTEKDAVKCLAFATSLYWMVPVTAELPDSFVDAVDRRLRR